MPPLGPSGQVLGSQPPQIGSPLGGVHRGEVRQQHGAIGLVLDP
jgi:hypothetical protein